jgi:hypothetical protein
VLKFGTLGAITTIAPLGFVVEFELLQGDGVTVSAITNYPPSVSARLVNKNVGVEDPTF